MKSLFIKYYFLALITFSTYSNLYSQSGWFPVNSGTTARLNSICFPPTATGFTGFTCGNNGTILKTVNGGNNWIAQVSGVTEELH